MRDIVVEQTIPFPREIVWDALTDAEQLSSWLMPNDFRPEIGHSFTFRTKPAPGFDGIVHSKVQMIDAPSRLVLTWRGGGIDTLVTFELEDAGTGTRVRIRHEGFAGFSNLMPRLILGSGWKSLIRKKLPEFLSHRYAANGGISVETMPLEPSGTVAAQGAHTDRTALRP